MKMSPVTVVLVSVVSSLVTVGTIELLRGPAPADAPAPVAESTGKVRAAAQEDARPAAVLLAPAEPELPESRSQGADLSERLAALERRMAEFESSVTARTPAIPPAPKLAEDEAMREVVFDWIAEEREVRKRDQVVADEQAKQSAMEFKARYQALELARLHNLEDWQQERWAELFLTMREREREILADIDIERDDPAEVEARWEEYDEWVDGLERELTLEITPELYEEFYGEE